MNAITTTHNLDFEKAPWDNLLSLFRVGTCEGLYGFTNENDQVTLDIVAVQNHFQGNGHFEDVLQWFEYAAKSQGIPLRIVEIYNYRLFVHLVEKRGFTPLILPNRVNVIKNLNEPSYPRPLTKKEKEQAKRITDKGMTALKFMENIAM